MSGNESGRSDYRNAGGKTPSIPLSDADRDSSGEASVGSLVKNATASVSTLFRSEVALAKAELVDDAKKAGAGTGLLIVAGVMALYASFFFFFFLAELLDEWVPRWLAFLIVFGILVVITLVAAFIGYLVFKKVRGPKKTISSVKEVQTVLPGRHEAGAGDPASSGQGAGHPAIPPAREA